MFCAPRWPRRLIVPAGRYTVHKTVCEPRSVGEKSAEKKALRLDRFLENVYYTQKLSSSRCSVRCIVCMRTRLDDKSKRMYICVLLCIISSSFERISEYFMLTMFEIGSHGTRRTRIIAVVVHFSKGIIQKTFCSRCGLSSRNVCSVCRQKYLVGIHLYTPTKLRRLLVDIHLRCFWCSLIYPNDRPYC